jgi:anti-sigma-K factor RskA
MTSQPDIHTLTGAYAVDALPEDEREMFEQHLMVCDACAQEVAELQATASRLGEVAHETPPPGLRERVLAEIDLTRQERPSPTTSDDLAARRSALPGADERPRRRAAGRLVTSLSVAAAAVLVVAVAGLSMVVSDLGDRLAQVETASSQVADVLAASDATLVTAEGPEGEVGRVVASETRGEAVFLADGLPPAPDGHTYELWLIEPETFVKAGLFDTDDDGRATRVMTGDLVSAAAIGVTVEPDGGSPQPTTDPVMVFELG